VIGRNIARAYLEVEREKSSMRIDAAILTAPASRGMRHSRGEQALWLEWEMRWREGGEWQYPPVYTTSWMTPVPWAAAGISGATSP
jgi:hypothetical protein